MLADGQVIRGRLVSETSEEVVVELVSGGELRFPRAAVKSIEDEAGARKTERGQLWFEDANRTRYFFGPSAMMMRRGEAYFSQKELFLSEFGYGLNDHLTVVAGTVPIAWFAGVQGINVLVGMKAGTPLGGRFHVAGGIYGLVLPNFSFGANINPAVGGFIFGTATYGENDWHFSVSGGYPFSVTSGSGAVGTMIVTASGNVRVARNVALVTENWFLLPTITAPGSTSTNWLLLDAFGARLMGEQFSVDIGGIWPITPTGLPLNFVPIPWLDFTYHFELGPK